MEWWWIAGALAVALVVAFLLVSLRVGSSPVFYAAYSLELQRTGSKEEALRWAIRSFSQRAPFNALTEGDVDSLVEIFAPLPDPRVLAQVFLEVDKRRGATLLRDLGELRAFAGHSQAVADSSSGPEARQLSNPYRRESALLVTIARLQAASSLKTVCDEDPGFCTRTRRPDFDAWQFCSAVAGVGIALQGLNDQSISPALKEELTAEVRIAVEAWNLDAWKVVEDFAAFLSDSNELPIPVKIGTWVLWNARGTRPPPEDFAALTAIGGLIETQLSGWWTRHEELPHELTLRGVPNSDIEPLIQFLGLKVRADAPQQGRTQCQRAAPRETGKWVVRWPLPNCPRHPWQSKNNRALVRAA